MLSVHTFLFTTFLIWKVQASKLEFESQKFDQIIAQLDPIIAWRTLS